MFRTAPEPMLLAKILVGGRERCLAKIEEDLARPLDLDQVEAIRSLSDILFAKDAVGLANFLVDQNREPVPKSDVRFLAPIDRQEVWAAGVTYKRSQKARMEESEIGADHYDRVYQADRPELFFKATAARVVGPGEPIRVRQDSAWTVPEPELALYVSPDGRLCGFTVGNDVSARDIEGENPLYLPQAKVYNQSAALGPCVLVPEGPVRPSDFTIGLIIERRQAVAFSGETSAAEMARSFEDLISWLCRDNEFPFGAVLMTGTGIVPPDDFSLVEEDLVKISISGIGTLENPVTQSY